ncbi:MFS transporter [Microvirga rosea]|uniref:MFS transporter n=1 Tax=Microvirga rosea TaxID=2715425 RepID=UPI001D0B011A|nr:MFS transporter [Microvirga rosea]MCB8820130.1 MFS transporter [Microvirga rosea]
MRSSPTPALAWFLMLGVAVVGSNSLALSPILGDVANDLQATPVAVARANAAYGGATAVSALALGRYVDRIGAERALALGLLVLAAAMVGSAAATHWIWLALSQGLAGAAGGIVLPASYALATAIAPPGRGAETLGRVLTGWSLSLVAGVPLSAAIASALSWRASYLVLAVLLVLAAIPLARIASGRKSDASTGSLSDALRRPGVVPLLAVCLLFMTAFYGVYAYIGDHARRLLGLSATEAGFIVLAYGAGFGFATFGDRFVDRFGAARLFPLVLTIVAATYVALIPGVADFRSVMVLAALWGFANHFGLNILVLQLSRSAPDARVAVLALNSAISYAGALVGAALFGLFYDRYGFSMVTGAAALCSGAAALIALMHALRSGAMGRISVAAGTELKGAGGKDTCSPAERSLRTP